MPLLCKSLENLHTDDFEVILAQEVAALGIDHLPLQQGLSRSSYALDDNLRVMILKTEETSEAILVKACLFYEGIIAGCSCADDPTPIDRQPEQCEIEININRRTAEASVSLV